MFLLPLNRLKCLFFLRFSHNRGISSTLSFDVFQAMSLGLQAQVCLSSLLICVETELQLILYFLLVSEVCQVYLGSTGEVAGSFRPKPAAGIRP